MANAWLTHVKHTMKKNKGKSFKRCLQLAKKTYHKKSGHKKSGHKKSGHAGKSHRTRRRKGSRKTRKTRRR